MTDERNAWQGKAGNTATSAPHPARREGDQAITSPTGAAASREVNAAPTLPSITLPKGGGAISPIDEKVTVGLATGAASLTVPVPVTAGRNGASPSLALTYDSGAPSGIFGMGWRMLLPSITRKTSRGLPRYRDVEDSDIFMLTGSEDLVPIPDAPASDPSGEYTVRRYRPRVEAGFSRIERWDRGNGDVHWRTISRDNATAVFGSSPASRIQDPANTGHIFSWLLDLSYDDRGNAILYEYKSEDAVGVPNSPAEHARDSTANKHLKRVHYGNVTPYWPATSAEAPVDWRFHVVLDYGDHAPEHPTVLESGPWLCRADSFSSYRSGFEIRSHRLCRRILLFHSFPEYLQARDVLVRSTDLTYTTDAAGDPTLPAYAQIATVVQSGYIRDPRTGNYSRNSRPPLRLKYTSVSVHDSVAVADRDAVANLPAGADGKNWQWVDLNGEGVRGLLTEDDGAWYYKRNVSAYAPDGAAPAARFEPLELVARKPIGPTTARSPQLVDLHGDGSLCAVAMASPLAGYFARDGEGWQPFRAFPNAAAIDWSSPDVRTVDLDGDGLADVLLTEEDAFTWYRWLAEDGFAPGERVNTTYDEDSGPHLVLSEGDSSVFLADMTGDGLSDLVRIRNGEASYWPNLGFGRFGAKVAMGHAPWFDVADLFDAKRLRLADIDGSGTADLVYMSVRGPEVWFNQSGNSFTDATQLRGFPEVDGMTTVETLDLLGSGTTCLVWSSPFPAGGGRQLRYVDLMGGVKPYLLVSVVNNMGGETTLTYATSTRFYLADRLAGTPWATHLAFPVHVVATKEIVDRITATRLVTTYRYHHGYFDSAEREFRGFGMVEESDAENVLAASGTGTFTSTPVVAGDDFALPAVRTRTWFHTGAYLGGEDIAAVLAREYWTGDPRAAAVGDTVFRAVTTPEEMREACRALRGRRLRTEVYADDGTALAPNPYAVTQHRYQTHLLQAPTDSSFGSVYACDLEALSYHYERQAPDPRVTHELVLEVDAFGTVTKSAAVAYARRTPGPIAQQTTALCTYTEHDVINVPNQPGWYRLGVPYETRTYELTGLGAADDTARLAPDAWLPQILAAESIPFDATPGGGPARRLVARTRAVYRSDDLGTVLAPGHIESMGLVDRAYTLAMTAALAARIYGGKTAGAAAIAIGEGGYVDLDGDGNWWAPTPRLFYSLDPALPEATYARVHFYLPHGQVDPFGGVTRVAWEADLAVVERTDPVGNLTTSVVNYRLLQPWLVADPNANRRGVRFDALGMVVSSAAMGKALPGDVDEGDHLDTTTAEAAAGDDPTAIFAYDLDAYRAWADDPAHDPNLPAPVYAHARTRVRHKDAATPWLQTYTYSDGMGRSVLIKTQAEPGDAPVIVGGRIAFDRTDNRWVGSGRVVYDNKANPVKEYEPFFDSNPLYTAEPLLVQWGVTAIMRYDPMSRVYRVDKPNGTFTAVEVDAWRSIAADDNDTVLDSKWYAARKGGGLGASEQDAAAKTAAHANTPLISDVDTLGRTVRSVADGERGRFTTSRVLDIMGRTLATVDALGRTVMSTDYGIDGAVLHSSSVDAGERWVLHDATGSPIREWDSRGFQVRHTYDAARRPLAVYVQSGEGGGGERLAQSLIYGEGLPDDVVNNLREAVHLSCGSAGLSTLVRRDFKGNVLVAQQQMLSDVRADSDWTAAPGLNAETFTTVTSYDALNRVINVTTPDTSVTTQAYNERSLLDGISVALRGGPPATYVQSIVYDAKGQRQSIAYGNGASTVYTYDPETFRLVHMVTTRPASGGPVQDITYTYDPVGNITRLVDAAQSTIFFANQLVAPVGDYTYDNIYRLLAAAGREHVGQNAAAAVAWDDSDRSVVPLPSDAQAMRNYTETFTYDVVGNIESVVHAAASGGWTRAYAYDEPAISPASNRLTSTTVGSTVERYVYDADGNMTSMPQLALLAWDFRNRLQTTARQVVASGDVQTTWYRYDGAGQRLRKSTLAAAGALQHERFYLGNFEVYREYAASGSVSLERQTVIVPDGAKHLALLETTTVDAARPAASPSTTARYQFANHLGSACVELDENAAVIAYEEYYPYGATSFATGRSSAEVSLKRYRFTGKERDEESSLYHFGVRCYAAWLGRWSSPDPSGLVDGPNLYAYCRGNPIILRDRQGTQGQHDPDPAATHAPPTSDPVTAAGDASVPSVLPWYNSPFILGPGTAAIYTLPNFSRVSGVGAFPSAVPGSPAASYLTLTWPGSVGQRQFTIGPDPTGQPASWSYQHQFGPSDPARSATGAVVGGGASLSGIPGLTRSPVGGVSGMLLLEGNKGGPGPGQPVVSGGVNLGWLLGYGQQLSTGGMGGYGGIAVAASGSWYPAGYWRDTPPASTADSGRPVEQSQVPRVTISAGGYANFYAGGPFDSTTRGTMLAVALGAGGGVTVTSPRFGVNTRAFLSGYVGYGAWFDNAAGGGQASGVFGGVGVGLLFGAAPTRPTPTADSTSAETTRRNEGN